jgi:benzil reductase ((S)-benzoin forming)
MIGYIITGTKRGLGKALASQALLNGDQVFSLSRVSDFFNARHINIYCDLSKPDEVAGKLTTLFSYIPLDILSAIVLINNAGVLDPIKPLSMAEPSQIQKNINVNLIAPAILIKEFLKLTQNFKLRRSIINISSGASKNAYAGWATYCSSKAGINMLTQCTAKEQGNDSDSVKISSFAPGVLDTDMQTQIHHSSPEDFPMQRRFILLKQQGALLSPDKVAQTLLDSDRNDILVQGKFHDIRDML